MQTELHRHLDVSLRLSTLLKLAQERGLEGQSTSLEAFREKLVLKKPLRDLTEVLGTFTLFQKVLDRVDVLDKVAFEVVEDCFGEGTRKVELRFSPSFVSEHNKMKWEDVLEGFERGMQRALRKFPGMNAGLICIASRDFGVEACEKTVDFFLAHQKRFVGLDLAGVEKEFPNRLFEAPFKKAIAQGARITVHAGEASGPENIWEALELLGAKRIGHGISAIHDPKLMKHLEENSICLEMCPTSNWITSAVPSLKEHPLPQVLRAGVPVCINTDDPAIFGVTIPHEIQICRNAMGLTAQEIQLTQQHASRASFISRS